MNIVGGGAADISNYFFSTVTNVTGSRSADTQYTNSTGKPILVIISFTFNASGTGNFKINGSSVYNRAGAASGCGLIPLTVIVPKGATYGFYTTAADFSVNSWWEIS